MELFICDADEQIMSILSKYMYIDVTLKRHLIALADDNDIYKHIIQMT